MAHHELSDYDEDDAKKVMAGELLLVAESRVEELDAEEEAEEEASVVTVDADDEEPAIHSSSGSASGGLLTAMLSRWLMSPTFYSSSIYSMRYKSSSSWPATTIRTTTWSSSC